MTNILSIVTCVFAIGLAVVSWLAYSAVIAQ